MDIAYSLIAYGLVARGIKKEDLIYSLWAKDIAPSDKLRKSFHEHEMKFKAFKESYIVELDNNDNKDDFLDWIEIQLEKHNVTLVYGAKDKEHNNAVILKEWTEENLQHKKM